MKFPFFKRQPKATPRTGRAIRQNPILPEHARILREVNGKMMRMYEAAVTNNLNADFPVSITSANAEIFTSIVAARSRAQRLERDNPYAKAIIETFQNNVCGEDPFRLEMNVGHYDAKHRWVKDKGTNAKIEAWWKQAGMPENCTTSRNMSRLELDLQNISSMVRDGGVLNRHRRGFDNEYGYAIQPYDIQQLDHYYNRPAKDGVNKIQFSIELDEFDAPLFYHILTRHPGDVFAFSNSPKYRERVPASDIIAFFDIRTRAGQIVGMPRFASIIQRLHRLDQFDIAHVTAAIWASCKPFFIVQEFPTAMEYVPDFIKKAMADGGGTGQDDGERIKDVEPGSGEVLPFGQKPMLVDPKFPIEAASGFKKEQLRAAAAGAGAAYHIIGQDLESVNFSSGRIGLEEFRAGCRIVQRHYITNHRRRHFNEALKYAIMCGKLDLPMSRYDEFKLAANFFGKRWPYIQPLQDAQADSERLRQRTTSRDRIIAESDRGGDYEQVASELASDNETDKEHELPPFDLDGNNIEPDGDEELVTETPKEKLGKANGHNGNGFHLATR